LNSVQTGETKCGYCKRESWKKDYPNLFSNLSSTDSDIRLTAIRSMTSRISELFIPVEIDSELNAITSRLLLIIESSPLEHDDVLFLLCRLCLQQCSQFDPYAKSIIAGLLPRLDRGDSLELFAVAFIVSFGLADEEVDLKLEIIGRYLDLLSRDKSNADCLNGLTPMLAVFDPEDCVGVLFERIMDTIDRCLMWAEDVILSTVVDMVAVIHEGLLKIQHPPIDIQKFTGRFVATLRKLQKKHKQMALAQRCREVEQQFNGKIMTTEFGLSDQILTITGARHHVALLPIQRACGDQFQQQMFQNRFTHLFFGNRVAVRAERAKSSRRRQRARKVALAAQRQQKDDLTDT
jgi:hypothetical protein